MKYLETLILALAAVFAPVKAVMITAMSLVIIDLITGVMAARKRGEKITSSGFKRTVGKIFLYESAICIGFLVQQYLTGELFPASKLIAALIGLTELKSILENLDGISDDSFFKTIITRVLQSTTDMENKK